MYDVCAHSSLPTSAILALGLLKKKEERKMMNNFAWAAITHFWISGASQAHFRSFKGSTNADTTVENAYTVKLA